MPRRHYRRGGGWVERGDYGSFAALRATFGAVDKVSEVFVFNIGGNKYRLVAGVDFAHRRVFIKAVLTHSGYDKGKWK